MDIDGVSGMDLRWDYGIMGLLKGVVRFRVPSTSTSISAPISIPLYV